MKTKKNKYLIQYLCVFAITTLIELLTAIVFYYLKNIPIPFKELGILVIGYNIVALFVIAQIHISSILYEAITYMMILFSVMIVYQCIVSKELELVYFVILLSSMSILLRIFIWKYHLEILNSKNTNREIKIDFSVMENSEEIFYRRIVLKANDKCSDLLDYFKKHYLNESEYENSVSYKFYISDKLIYIITDKTKIEYCHSFDYELGSFPIKKVLVAKVEIISDNLNKISEQ
ncbi:hypothetical protein [Treponema sp.]|uniref:hypothetical protein n=1 Tax=Treponema sp. TaxID=166 RepID=UPI00298ECE0D|nr:hypothetical protein [Treponema sp.]MCR5612673.1 hypothetical protein [Treponema sp.]